MERKNTRSRLSIDRSASNWRLVACKKIALLVAYNQPFYPAYVIWILGAAGLPALATLLSTPFFLAVPLLGNRNERAGKTLLVASGVGNTILSLVLFGPNVALQFFLIPCALISMIGFGSSERLPRILLLLGCSGAFALVSTAQLPVVMAASEAEMMTLRWLHGVSAGCLSLLIVYIFWSTRQKA